MKYCSYFIHTNFDFSISSNKRSPFVTSNPLKNAFKLCTYLSKNHVTRTNLFNELNLPQSVIFPIPTSLSLKLTMTLETTSLLPFSSKSTFFGNKNSCDGHVSFPPNKNSGPFHHNKQLYNLLTEHSLVQISAGFKTPIFYVNICLTSTLFWTQIFRSLSLC